ncbi:MAG: phosphatase PAP2 family protein [Flavobacteriaceae bacterium]|nr:phosphatase PAP2 family protein [Flavobacteriaceae bacterium]
MKNIIFQLRPFLIISFSLFLFILLITLESDKTELHLFLNGFHSEFADAFFYHITAIGDASFALILLPYLLCFASFRVFIWSVLTCLIAGLLAQFFKKIVFYDALRPSALIPIDQLHIVDSVHLYKMYSFPSGHTASAFALFLLLAFYNYRKTHVQYVMVFFAFLVGYSRVYLSQHFIEDVLFGGILGILSFFISFMMLQKFHFQTFNQSVFDLVFANNKIMLSFKQSFEWKI